MKPGRIRVLALGLINQGDRTLMIEGYDRVKQSYFYRALGGGVDFGETSLEALKREFQEEIQAELTNIQYLTCIESQFTCHGKPGHEIIQLYQCDFVEEQLYQRDRFIIAESNETHTARWIEIDRLKSGELHLVPEACLAYF